MAVVIRIPTWVTFNKIPVGTPAVGLAILNGALGASLSPGDANPVWQDLQDLDLGGGPLTRGQTLDSLATVDEIQNAAFLEIAQVQLAVALGGEVDGMLVYFEIDDLTDEVPAEFPNRTYTVLSDPEDLGSGVETAHTWETWGAYEGDSAGDLPVQVGEKWYRTSRDRNNGGDYMPASAWVPASQSGLVVLQSLPEEE